MVDMAVLGGRAVGFSSFPSSSYFCRNVKTISSAFPLQMACTSATLRGYIACSALQETSTSAVAAETKDAKPVEEEAVAAKTKEAKPAEKEAPAKPKPAAKVAKAPSKQLPELMKEDVIPSLKAILEAQDDLSNIELTFQDSKLEGSFTKKGNNYSFWAFFPYGVLTGPKGFSLTSFGSEASTVEPFLIDEKKITAKHIVFWVEKRLAAQGILPVWKD